MKWLIAVKDKFDLKVEPYYPYYCKSPNKLIRYEQRPFEDCLGNTAMVTIAVFQDKSGKLQEADAHVKWINRK